MISCVITTYKREPEVLKKAVDSILSQSYKDIEIIVVNDAPEDSELSNRLYKMLSEYDFPINYIVHESNKGACEARNTVIKNSNGEYIAFLDDDDELEKEKDAGNIQSNTALQISNNIRMHLGTDDEWDFFKMQFVKVHPDFFVRLKTLCPSITEGELRLCAYIRTGMENKHIAQMLSLQPESVKKNRYRLRQKLNLGKESLEDFLRGI